MDPSTKISVRLSEAADLLSISKRKLWSLATSGEVPSFKQGNSRLFFVEALRDWCASKVKEAQK